MQEPEQARPLEDDCANGHKRTITLSNGKHKCLDCDAEW